MIAIWHEKLKIYTKKSITEKNKEKRNNKKNISIKKKRMRRIRIIICGHFIE